MIVPQKNHELRNKFDKYLTPYSLTQHLLDTIELDKFSSVLEPCSSVEGCIVKVLKKNGFTNITENVYDEEVLETNLFHFDTNKKYDYIITNTPYGKCIIPMIQQLKKIATKQIICLYPISTLHSTRRYNKLWNDKEFSLKQVLMFIRPPWLKDTVQDNGKYQGGMNAYGWFIWEKGYIGDIQLKLIDNSLDLNKKGDC